MKNILTSLATILLVMWYSLSIIGFDVHTCNSSGRTFIATIASGFECEDIHDLHEHADCCCCHSEKPEHEDADLKFEDVQCCSDMYHVIVLTGVRGEDDTDGSNRIHVSCGYEMPSCNIASGMFLCPQKTVFKQLDERTVFRDVQSLFNIWRI